MRADDVRGIPVGAIRIRAAAPSGPSSAALPFLCSASSSTLHTLSTRGALTTRGTLSTLRTRGTPAARRPSPFIGTHLRTRKRRTNALRLSRPEIHATNVSVLRCRVHDGRVFGIASRLKSIAAADDIPVAGPDSPAAQRSRRPAFRPVVLRSTADVVERLRVVDRHAVVLRHRNAGKKSKRRAFVVGFVQPAVVADQNVILVAR